MNNFNLRINIIRALIEINENVIFYPKIRRFYKYLKNKNDFNLVFDIGTNKGQTIKQLKKINHNIKIFGFEPNKYHFDNLVSKNINNVEMFQLGCSDKEGEFFFHENILDESSTFEDVNMNSKWLLKKAEILGKDKHELIKKSYPVKCIKLANFIKENKIKEIDLVKIDVEGHEFKVLKGLLENNNSLIKYIQFESHNDDLYFQKESDDVDNLMLDNGFELHLSIRHGFGKFYDKIFKNKNLNA